MDFCKVQRSRSKIFHGATSFILETHFVWSPSSFVVHSNIPFPPLFSLQCSSWPLVCWCTLLALAPHWSDLSAETLTSTTPASARSAGATCWLSLESCSPSSCPFLPNMHRRSSCPPPHCPLCYSSVLFFLFYSWPLYMSRDMMS